MRQVVIMINDQCLLRCRHCSAGYPDRSSSGWEVEEQELVDYLFGVDCSQFDGVMLAGGEPALSPKLILTAIFASQLMGLDCGIITAPFWAPTATAAQQFLSSVPGLRFVCLSYDAFHLEQLSIRHYENALRAAQTHGTMATLAICVIKDSDLPPLLQKIAHLQDIFGPIAQLPMVPVGSAARLTEISQEGIAIGNASDVESLPRTCRVGYPLIDSRGRLHACCWSVSEESSPLVFQHHKKIAMRTQFERMNRDPIVREMSKKGFITTLGAATREEIANFLNGRRILNECHLCLLTMRFLGNEEWRALFTQ